MNEPLRDFELLQAFVRQGEQWAFAQVVRRHLDLVYATAFRKLQDSDAAQEVAQNTFLTLGRKAWQFAPDDSLPAWLHRTAILFTKEWLRGEIRRRRREQTAAELGTTMKTPDDQRALCALVPLLDEALLSLREKERAALLLRFYENQSLREVGAALGVGEDAAHKRVTGALGKVALFFQRKGYRTATLAAVTAALQQTTGTAPAAVVNTVLLAASQMAPPPLLGLAAIATRIASWTKLQTATICLAAAAVPVAWQWQDANHAHAKAIRIQAELQNTQSELGRIRTEIDSLTRASGRLDDELLAAGEIARKQADAERKFQAWKTRLWAQLTSKNYQWPEDSPLVRIPKSALEQLGGKNLPVCPPGVLPQSTRELLGLTPEERETIESALQRYFAAVEELLESKICRTNQTAAYGHKIPKTALASCTWSVSALGEEGRKQNETLAAMIQATLGPERWTLVAEAQLRDAGSHPVRRILSADALDHDQEISVWIEPDEGSLVVGTSWAKASAITATSGGALASFGSNPDATQKLDGPDWIRGLGRPEAFTAPVLQWLQEQAALHAGAEGVR